MSATDTMPARAPATLERRFALAARGTSVRTETIAGVTSFLAAAYLLVVIPSLLATGGMERGAATTATIIVFVLFTTLMPMRTCRSSSAPASAAR